MALQKRKSPPPQSEIEDVRKNTSLLARVSDATEARPKKRLKVRVQSPLKTTDPMAGPSTEKETPSEPGLSDAPNAPTPAESKKSCASSERKKARRPRSKITKLAPERPFPRVPLGSDATTPYSTRGEGKNTFGVSRGMSLGAYLRRCMEVINVDGYRTVHLSAMGAAVPHAMLLATSLPVALKPTFGDDIKTSIITGTVQCVDEVIPDEEDEDEDEGGMEVRFKSCINIDIVLGDGERVNGIPKKLKGRAKKTALKASKALEELL